MEWKFDDEALEFSGRKIKPSVRRLLEMAPVLATPKKDSGLAPDSPTYYMYRDVAHFGKIRYDVTRILSLDLAGERNKTLGHVHPRSAKGAAWPEVYEVLSGEAHFLLQKVTQLGVQDAVLLSAKKGECLLIPPGYGHVTINAGKRELVLGNLVSSDFDADYSQFLRMRGGCYYEMHDGKLVRNRNYGEDFELRKLSASEFSSAFGTYAPFRKGLLAAVKKPEDIEFLKKPEMFY
ncbi:MAG: glucose-6-phosphate isomerase [Candidatus Micrarchaeota archaeon]|nr:glucose-6-phosphate isomerase [Candidatus Micrarchaeota archaeon]